MSIFDQSRHGFGVRIHGRTTLGQAVARALGWDFINVGERFRRLCDEQGLAISVIPLDVHRRVDAQVQLELQHARRTVIEGRYTGFFAQGYPDVLKVLVEAGLSHRAERCLAIEPGVQSAREAEIFVRHRDTREERTAKAMYGVDHFADHAFFDLIFQNVPRQHIDAAVDTILHEVRHHR